MDIIWVSANEFGFEMLREVMKIRHGISVKAILTLSEDATTVMYDSVAREKWYDFGVPVYEVRSINDSMDLLRKLLPATLVVCGWRQLVKKDILDLFSREVIGFHPALLPVGRGSAPIINAILHGFKKSGISMFYMKEGIDDGDIIGQEWFNILDADDSIDVYDKVIVSGRVLVRKYFPLLADGLVKAVPQDGSKVLVFDKPKLSDNRIYLDKESLEQVYRKIKALSRYLGAYIEKDGKKLIIRKAELVDV
jgi:methionyl-tRNA formyltransferase